MQRHYYSDPDFGTIEVTDRVGRVEWETKENAEEGSTAMVTVVLDDPDMDLEIVGHRKWFIIEDESEATDDIVFGGFVADQQIGRSGGDWTEHFGRVWTVTLTDANAIWQRRIMVGSDCKRPAETDVERMQWLLSTAEAALFDDVTTYVATGSPVAMDADTDYRGQSFSQIADDCAQASGKNWWAGFIFDGYARNLTAWYGRDSVATYDSDLFLTNNLADIDLAALEDGSSVVYPISLDTKLSRDPSRVYSGCYLAYDGGAVYRYDSDTAAAFAKRDFAAPSLNVKSSTKASARALRYLADLDDQDLRITTSIEVPKGKATMLRAGMRVRFRATHLPGFASDVFWQWCRVLNCAVKPIAVGDRYRLTLELAPTGGAWQPPYEGTIVAELLASHNDWATSMPPLYWWGTGDDPPSGYPGHPKQGPFEYVGTPGHWDSLICTAPCTVDIYVEVHWMDVQTKPYSTYICHLQAGVAGHSDTVSFTRPLLGPAFRSHAHIFQLTGIPLDAGDEVVVTIATDPVAEGMRVSPGNNSVMRVTNTP